MSMSLHSYEKVRGRLKGRNLTGAQAREEAWRLVAYLRANGAKVSRGGDVYCAVRSLTEEEELGAERCREGVAVTHASEGWIVLIPTDWPFPLEAAETTENAPAEFGGC